MVGDEQNLSTKWQGVVDCVVAIRQLLDSCEFESEPSLAVGLCQHTLTSLAKVVFDPKSNSLPISVVPSNKNAIRRLDEYFVLKLAGEGEQHQLRTIRTMLDNAAGPRTLYSASSEDAVVSMESVLSIVTLTAKLSGIDPIKVTGAA